MWSADRVLRLLEQNSGDLDALRRRHDAVFVEQRLKARAGHSSRVLRRMRFANYSPIFAQAESAKAPPIIRAGQGGLKWGDEFAAIRCTNYS